MKSIEKKLLICPECGAEVACTIEYHLGEWPTVTPDPHITYHQPDSRVHPIFEKLLGAFFVPVPTACPGAPAEEWQQAFQDYLEGLRDVADDHRLHLMRDGDDDMG